MPVCLRRLTTIVRVWRSWATLSDGRFPDFQRAQGVGGGQHFARRTHCANGLVSAWAPTLYSPSCTCLRPAGLMLGYLPALDSTMRELHENLYGTPGAGSVGHFLSLQLYCTDTDQQACEELKSAVARTGMEQHLSFGRPKLEERIVSIMRYQLEHRIWAAFSLKQAQQRTLVTYCGSPGVAKLCAAGCLKANTIAGNMGYRGHQFYFRNEHYGIVAGKAPKVKPGGGPPTDFGRAKPETEFSLHDPYILKIDEGGEATGEVVDCYTPAPSGTTVADVLVHADGARFDPPEDDEDPFLTESGLPDPVNLSSFWSPQEPYRRRSAASAQSTEDQPLKPPGGRRRTKSPAPRPMDCGQIYERRATVDHSQARRTSSRRLSSKAYDLFEHLPGRRPSNRRSSSKTYEP